MGEPWDMLPWCYWAAEEMCTIELLASRVPAAV